MQYRALLVLSALLGAPLTLAKVAAAQPRCVQGTDQKAEFEKRRKEAEGSVEKLWQLYDWCTANGMDKDGRSVLRSILKLDDKDKKAHTLLGEIEFDGKWFPNQKKVDEYKQKKLEDEAKKSGKVVYNGEFVDPADLPNLQKGLKKLDDGRWVNAEEYKHVTEGWVQQDLEWVPPAEAENIKKGLFKCGDKWLAEAEANTYHSEIEQCWKIPSDHFVVYTTCDRKQALKARTEAERASKEFSRVLGTMPEKPVPVLVLRSEEQYNAFASTQGTELRGFSSLHGATIAELWSVPLMAGMTSAGYCYWDVTDPKREPFGAMFVRHAAAQSLAEALDPSPKTLEAFVEQKPIGEPDKEWWEEKKLPQWLRYGACAYVERYMLDQFVNVGGDPGWMKKWSLDNIANKGGIDPLETILTCNLSIDDASAVTQSQKLMNESGLLMAFILDGKCAAVTKEHQALKDAFKNGKDLKAPLKGLEEALKKNEAELRKYAGI